MRDLYGWYANKAEMKLHRVAQNGDVVGVNEFSPMYVYSQINGKRFVSPEGVIFFEGDPGANIKTAFAMVAAQGIDTLEHYIQDHKKAGYVVEDVSGPKLANGRGGLDGGVLVDYDWIDQPTPSEIANAANYRFFKEYEFYSFPKAPREFAANADEFAELTKNVKLWIKTRVGGADPKPVAIGLDVRGDFVGGSGVSKFLSSGVYYNVEYGNAFGGDASWPKHAVLIVGYDDKGVLIQNHWGAGWGDKGFAWVSWDVVLNDVFMAVAVKDSTASIVAELKSRAPKGNVTLSPSIMAASGGTQKSIFNNTSNTPLPTQRLSSIDGTLGVSYAPAQTYLANGSLPASALALDASVIFPLFSDNVPSLLNTYVWQASDVSSMNGAVRYGESSFSTTGVIAANTTSFPKTGYVQAIVTNAYGATYTPVVAFTQLAQGDPTVLPPECGLACNSVVPAPSAPSCSSVTLAVVNAGGSDRSASALANCTGSITSYKWTLNGSEVAGANAALYMALPSSATDFPLTGKFCVTATNTTTNATSTACKSVVQPVAALSPPTCTIALTDVNSNPLKNGNQLFSNGGSVRATSSCPGAIYWQWRIVGGTLQSGSALTGSGIIGVFATNATLSPVTGQFCVKGGNGVSFNNPNFGAEVCVDVTTDASVTQPAQQASCQRIDLTFPDGTPLISLPSSGGVVKATSVCSVAPSMYEWYTDSPTGGFGYGVISTPNPDLAASISVAIPANTIVGVNARFQATKVCARYLKLDGTKATICSDDVIVPAPVAPSCSSVTMLPDLLPTAGGLWEAVANCSGNISSYTWTVNNGPYTGSGARITGSLEKNAAFGGLPICVTATNASGTSAPVCGTISTAPPPPPCQSISVPPGEFFGGLDGAQANCTDTITSYVWTVNGLPYPGNTKIISINYPMNTSSDIYQVKVPICVKATNTDGYTATTCADAYVTGSSVSSPAPVCSSVTITPNMLTYSGGPVSIQANCSGSIGSYVWTLDGASYGNRTYGVLQPSISDTFPANTTSSPQVRSFCVTANNTTGSSAKTCATLTVVPQGVPSCTAITLSPNSLPYSGGQVAMQAACSGGTISTYNWTMDNTTVVNVTAGIASTTPFNVATESISPTWPVNNSTSPVNTKICVAATNAAGTGLPFCTNLTTAAHPPPPPNCSTVDFSPSPWIDPTEDGYAIAACTGKIDSYAFTFNGAPIPNYAAPNAFQAHLPFQQNTTTSILSAQVCVVASNESGSSVPVCGTIRRNAATVASPAPTCTSVSLTPSTQSSSGGPVSIQASCSGIISAYKWTLNGAAYGSNAASLSDTFPANTTTSAQTRSFCVTASNATGNSALTCATLTTTPPSAPTCTSVSLSRSILPYTENEIVSQANCSGGNITSYTWTTDVPGASISGNTASVSSYYQRNYGTAPLTGNICVRATNVVGTGVPVCATFTQNQVPPPPPICSITFNPGRQIGPYEEVGAVAGCVGTVDSYSFTFNGTAIRNWGKEAPLPFPANFTSDYKYGWACVVASNAGGNSAQVCGQVVRNPS